ncbi:DUF6194 family protein [Micromonospora endolithica]|uniref:DUF6194 domain-containing protein n=1 Tax=Micromonospora endolithica TaxID=230091 RepID=A0A3A9YVS3_9ACTN|nr:DUF6194 family protein [Micromonospora endolithica]RKN39684.1 hypothetical protein D7223_28455 [Micromonospora endolithica]TWJ22229.1 hypothetical protein JD76_02344 [Micromonospora endolithica]
MASFPAPVPEPSGSADDVTAWIAALPEAEVLIADEASGAPAAAWGDRFFFVGPDRRRPFATLVDHDHAGFDEESRLDRPGVFRLSVELGRAEFTRRFGYPPAEFPAHRASVDFAALDRVVPHPVYGTHGWACVLNPGPASRAEVDRLLGHAHGLARRRHHRSRVRSPRPG